MAAVAARQWRSKQSEAVVAAVAGIIAASSKNIRLDSMAQTATDSELLVNVGAGAVAGACQIALFNPLDCLRVRWQVAAPGTAPSASEFALAIVRTEGWWAGLHRPGLLVNCAAISTSQGLRFGLYPAAREVLVAADARPAAAPLVMFASGLLSGCAGYFVAAPLMLLKVRAHAAAQLRLAGLCTAAPVVPTSLFGFWLGSGPLVVRGALLTAGQMAGYDGAKRAGRASGVLRDGPVLHALAAVVAGLCAATASAPADVVQTRMQSAAQRAPPPRLGSSCGPHPPAVPLPTVGVVATMRVLAHEGGPAAFFRGWGLSVLRMVPTFIVGTAVIEQLRRAMGLTYLR